MDKKGATSVAKELLAEWKPELKGTKVEDYMNYNFDDTWDHFDVNKTGLVEIERMSSFYKMFLKDYTLDLQ